MGTLANNGARGERPAADVVVTCSCANARAAALALARSLQLPFHDSPPPAAALQLTQTETRLELHDGTGSRLWVEYSDAELRRYRAGSGRDLLRRAVGPRAKHVIDATAGLGRDAVHLAMLGYRTTAIERSAVLGALVRDGLERARRRGLLPRDNPAWHTGEACAVLPEIDPPAAAVYLDPMFPAKRKKSAAVRKEISFLRLLATAVDDAAELLAVARACATERIVVKRPLDAPPLASDVSASYRGKLIRYDVYRTAP